MVGNFTVEREMFVRLNESRLAINRNFAFGGAAASLLILLAAYAVGLKDAPPWPGLEEWLHGNGPKNYRLYGGYFVVYGAAFALPFWLALGSVYEFYIMLGEETFPHLRSATTHAITVFLVLVAGFAQFASVAGIFMHLLPEALEWFLGSTLVATVIGFLQLVRMNHWLRTHPLKPLDPPQE